MPDTYAAWAARWRVPVGFAAGAVYLVFSQPTPRSLLVGGAVALVGLLLRAWAAGCLDKNRDLATAGPYAYTRNPLYLGSALMGAGFALAAGSWLIAGVFAGVFLLIYWPVIRREEAFLRSQFGDRYERYAAAVPLFLPSPFVAQLDSLKFSRQHYIENREYEAALGYAAALVFLALKMALG